MSVPTVTASAGSLAANGEGAGGVSQGGGLGYGLSVLMYCRLDP